MCCTVSGGQACGPQGIGACYSCALAPQLQRCSRLCLIEQHSAKCISCCSYPVRVTYLCNACCTGCAAAPSPPTTCKALGMHGLLPKALLSSPEWCIVLVPGPLMVPPRESITDMMPWMRALVPRESPVALFLLPLEPMLCNAAYVLRARCLSAVGRPATKLRCTSTLHCARVPRAQLLLTACSLAPLAVLYVTPARVEHPHMFSEARLS